MYVTGYTYSKSLIKFQMKLGNIYNILKVSVYLEFLYIFLINMQ